MQRSEPWLSAAAQGIETVSPGTKNPGQAGAKVDSMRWHRQSRRSVATTATVEHDDQAQDEDEQVDVGEVHAQGTCEVLVIAVGAGHRIEVDEGGAHEEHGAKAGDHQLKAGAVEPVSYTHLTLPTTPYV